MGNSQGTAKIGGVWKSRVYFDPYADRHGGPDYDIFDDDLKEQFSQLVDDDEQIIQVTVYKHPLSRCQITDFLFYHNFVLFKTNKWSWTIEKNSQGITIQRSEYREHVQNRYRQEVRNATIKEVITDKGRRNMRDFIKWLYEENELNKTYHYLCSNCKHFAKAVFDYVAKTKYM